MTANISEIKAILNSERDMLLSDYGVKDIGIFGSVSKDEHTEQSDIDILVGFSKPIGFFKFIELENHLSRLLGKKVDLVTKSAIKSVIRKEVLSEVVYV